MRGFADIRLLLLTVGLVLSAEAPASAAPLGVAVDPYRLCTDAIARQDRTGQTPRHLLSAIALAESGRRHPVTKSAVPWPWAVMSEGRGRYLATKAEAIAEVRGLQARGIRNIDVGCMQINLGYHPNAFGSLEEAFDPAANVAYAAEYLRSLYQSEGSWQDAAGRYHSATPQHKIPYQERVLAYWNKQQKRALEGIDDDPAGDPVMASLASPRNARTPALRQRQPTPAMINQFVRQLRMPTVRRGGAVPVTASADQPGLVRLPLPSGKTAPRDPAASARFAERRAEYMQAWRDGVQARSGPVTVVRGTAQQVYTFDMR